MFVFFRLELRILCGFVIFFIVIVGIKVKNWNFRLGKVINIIMGLKLFLLKVRLEFIMILLVGIVYIFKGYKDG